MFTVSTAPALVLLALAACLRGPARWGAFGALVTLQDAAMILQPAPFGVAWAAYFCLLLAAFPVGFSHILRQVATTSGALLLGVLLCNLVGILAVLTVFNGKFLVMPNFAFFDPNRAVYADFYRPHINQLIYLILGIGSTLWILAFARRFGWAETFRRIEAALLGFVLFSAGLAVWEWFAANQGFWFPRQFLHSDLASTAWLQSAAGRPRISGPFSEPSELGAQIGIAAAILAARGAEPRLAGLRGFAILSACVALLISTSTTGYAMLAAVACCYVASAFATPLVMARNGALALSQLWRSAQVLVISAIGLAAGLALLQYLIEQHNFYQVLVETLFHKQRSESFQNREYSNALARQIFVQTRFIGIGLGGHVASAGIFNILASLGVVGAALLLGGLAAGAISPLLAGSAQGDPAAVRAAASARVAIAGGCLAVCAALLMSLANINFQLFWLVLAGALASAGATGRPLDAGAAIRL